jgi:hypothetical protein
MNVIDATSLFLTATDCGIPALTMHGLGEIAFDDEVNFVQPLRNTFSKVVVYDLGKNYAEIGARRANQVMLDIIRSERPKYVVWPSRMYEVLESTFQAARQHGTLVVGWFFDDEIRFDDYSRWWIPYLDYCLTNDPQAVAKYEALGVRAVHFVSRSNPEVLRRIDGPWRYDVTFVGRKFGDRGDWIEALGACGINAQAFGCGWDNGHVSTEEMVSIFNQSKVNLCFTGSYGVNTRPQMKDRIFHVCMCGGFLLCEYVAGIEENFEIDREIVCFTDLEEATAKIQYYLAHEAERESIAHAGWQRAQRDHTQQAALLRAFEAIDQVARNRPASAPSDPIPINLPPDIRRLPSDFHLSWAHGLVLEGYPVERWREELDLALHYDPENAQALRLQTIGRFPTFARAGLLHLLAALGHLKQSLRARAAMLPVLKGSKQVPSDIGGEHPL